MVRRSSDHVTDFIYRKSGDRAFGTVSGRTIRRAAERKRRIEAKKLARQQSKVGNND